MRILKLNIIEFGCLKNVKLDLSEGLNILSGGNESGKSTVMLFIKYMLYGLPKKSAKNYDRERALSFDGHRAAGSMTFEHGGEQYRIERSATGTTRVSEDANAICLRTGESVGTNIGERFLGVPCEVFESSCSVSQMRASEINRTAAASAIENIMVSADESVDVTRVLDRIDKVRKEYRLNRGDGGILFDTRMKISELRAKRDDAMQRQLRYNESSDSFNKKQGELVFAEEELGGAESELARIRDAQTLARFELLGENKRKLDETKAALTELEGNMSLGGYLPSEGHVSSLATALSSFEAAKGRQSEREEEYRAALDGANADETLAEIGEHIESEGGVAKIMTEINAHNKKSRGLRTLGVISVLLMIAAGAAAAFVTPLIAIAAAVLAAVAIVGFVGSASAKKSRDAICAKYGKSFSELERYLLDCVEQLRLKTRADSALIAAKTKADAAAEDAKRDRASLVSLLSMTKKDVPDADAALCEAVRAEMRRIKDFCDERASISKSVYELSAVCNSDSAALSEFDEQKLRESVGDAPVSIDAQSVSDAQRAVLFHKTKRDSLAREVTRLREEIASLGASLGEDPIVIGDRICELEKKLARDSEYFEALMLAKDCIEQASVSISGNITPEISKKAGDMIALISDGKHASVQTTKDLSLSVEQDGFSMPAELLSGGTRDVAYICLRLSIMLKLFGEELPPLLLDEALCQLDDGRAEEMLTLVAKLSEEYDLQTLLFTCHTRERHICEAAGIVATLIDL